MARYTLKCVLICCFFLICFAEAKKHKESKNKKAQKEEISIDNEKSEAKEQDFMKTTLTETSLPGAAVAQNALPAATKESDAHTEADDDDVESGDSDEISGSGDEVRKKDESANKPSKVKSHILVEKDKNKIAESVKKSKVTKSKNGSKAAKTQNQAKPKTDGHSDGAATKKAKDLKTGEKKRKSEKMKDNNKSKDTKKRSKDGHHHHHHHHHHKQEKKNKRPKVENDANKPKVDYPTFNWTKDGDKVKKVAQIPGWGSSGAVGLSMGPGGPIGQMAQVPIRPPVGLVQRDSVPVPALLNGTIRNQADIASLDQSATATDQTALKDQTKPEATKEQSTTDNASDAFKNPVAAAVVSDTGEVPSNLTKKLDLQIPDTIPSRCTSLVKSYTNAEITLRDYLKQLRKCKKADADFNSLHPNGVAMLRDAISKNGPYLTKEAYKYALERVRNYVPSSKEKEAADMILAKWRSNSFGSRDKVSGNGDVPDAIKSFMTGQTSEHEKAVENERKIEEQTQKAIDTAKSYILGTITGRTGDENKQNENGNKKATIVASTKQSVINAINAAKSFLTGEDNGKAILLTQGSNTPAVVPLPDVKKEQIANVEEKKAKALEMAKTADVLNAAMLSQLSPNVVTKSEQVSSNLIAALRDMGSGPEPAMQPGVRPSVQKRGLLTNEGIRSRRKRSLSKDFIKRFNVINRRKKRQVSERPSDIDNPSERSKLNKPVIPAPKLMDKIRDMSMVIATP